MYQYDAFGRMSTMIACDPLVAGNGVQYQATKYLYGSPINGSLQIAVVYPDSTDTVSQDSNGDWVISSGTDHTWTSYDTLGRTATSTDQRGVTHVYLYNSAGQPSEDEVISFGGTGSVDRAIAP